MEVQKDLRKSVTHNILFIQLTFQYILLYIEDENTRRIFVIAYSERLSVSLGKTQLRSK